MLDAYPLDRSVSPSATSTGVVTSFVRSGFKVVAARSAERPIMGHDLAWAGGELWVANTGFSCLAVIQPNFSFVPRWRVMMVPAKTFSPPKRFGTRLARGNWFIRLLPGRKQL